MSMSDGQYFVVDAFASQPFSGNPAAVMWLDAWRSDEWLQSVAAEFNLSETVYLVPNDGGETVGAEREPDFQIRWFTPATEVDLCGHATLAAGKVLASLGKLHDGANVRVSSLSGVLEIARVGDSIRLDFPADPPARCDAPAGMLQAFGIDDAKVWKGKYDYLLVVGSERLVRQLCPDFRQLAALNCRGFIVTATADTDGIDFVSRFFAPAAGIDEDPVTGSAHCCLGEYWSEQFGRDVLVGHQVSRRGGMVQIERDDGRVRLTGTAVIVSHGHWVG